MRLQSPPRAWSGAAALLAPIVASAWFVGSLADSATPAPPRPSGLVEREHVRLAQFDVVVRDAAGRLVSGLGADAFRVVEGGEELEIVAVDEWGKPPARPAPASETVVEAPEPPPATAETLPPTPPIRLERRSIVLLFDNLNAGNALRLHQAKRAAQAFVRDHVSAEDLVAVYQLDMALRALSGFSGDPPAIEEAIRRVAWMPESTFADEIAEGVLAYRSRAGLPVMEERLRRGALLESQIIDWRREHFYNNLKALSEVFEALPGRRVLVLLSAGFPLIAAGDFERAQGGFTINFRELIKQLGQSGVVVYGLDLGDDLATSDVSRPVNWRVAVGKIGLDESILTDIGLDRDFSTGSAGARRQVLGVLAGETGGRLFTQQDLSKAFEIIHEESSRFYRISCRVSRRSEGNRYQRIVVRTADPELRVSARRGRYGDVVPGGGRAGSASDEPSSLASYRPLALRGKAIVVSPPSASEPAVVDVVIEALGPLDYPTDAGGGANVDLDFFLLARAGERIVDRTSRSLQARVQPAGVPRVREGFRVEGVLHLPAGHYDLQANLRINEPAQFGTLVLPLHVSAATEPVSSAPLQFDGLVLSQADEATPLLIQAERGTDDVDPLQLRPGVRILPATEIDFRSPGRLAVLFWLGGLRAEAMDETGVDLAVRIEDAAGRQLELPVSLLVFRPIEDARHQGLFEIDLESLAEGSYLLEVSASSPDGVEAFSRSPFRVRPRNARPPATTSSLSTS